MPGTDMESGLEIMDLVVPKVRSDINRNQLAAEVVASGVANIRAVYCAQILVKIEGGLLALSLYRLDPRDWGVRLELLAGTFVDQLGNFILMHESELLSRDRDSLCLRCLRESYHETCPAEGEPEPRPLDPARGHNWVARQLADAMLAQIREWAGGR